MGLFMIAGISTYINPSWQKVSLTHVHLTCQLFLKPLLETGFIVFHHQQPIHCGWWGKAAEVCEVVLPESHGWQEARLRRSCWMIPDVVSEKGVLISYPKVQSSKVSLAPLLGSGIRHPKGKQHRCSPPAFIGQPQSRFFTWWHMSHQPWMEHDGALKWVHAEPSGYWQSSTFCSNSNRKWACQG